MRDVTLAEGVVSGSITITWYYGGPAEEAVQEIEGEGVTGSQVQYRKPRTLIWQNTLSQTRCSNRTKYKQRSNIEL